MRILTLVFLLFLVGIPFVHAQVKIGENPQNIDASSILELEGTTRALVITRMNDIQMNGLNPLRGALVYNTDQGCVFYYNGTSWENLCADNNTTNIGLELQESQLILTDSDGNTVSVELGSAIGQTFSTDAVENFTETIVITQTGENYNFEVSEITGREIADSTIQGVDLAPESITQDKIGAAQVGSEELQENAVSDSEIDYSQVTLSDFDNDAGFLTISPEAGNAIIDNNGAFYDDTLLQDDIAANAQGLADHIAADGDLDDQNELVTSVILDGENNLILFQPTGPISVPLASLNNSGTDEQVVDLFDIDSDQLRISLQNDGQAPQTVDLSPYLDNTDEQQLSIAGNRISLTDGGFVDLPVAAVPDGSETIVNQGTNITITGSGTTLDPYIVNAAAAAIPDGSETIVNQGTNVTVTGSGTTIDPYIINAVAAIPDGSETIVNQGTNVTITGSGTTLDPYIINSTQSVEEVDGLTLVGTGTNVDPFRINPSTIPGQFLRTDPITGNVIWDDLPTGTGGAVSSDGITITGDGVATDLQIVNGGVNTLQLANDAITAAKLANDVAGNGLDQNTTTGAIDIIPGNTDGQVLKWNNTSGQWEIGTDEQGSPIVDTDANDGLSDFDPATGYNVNVDGTTIAINASDQLEVADDAITAAKLANDVAGNGLDQNATTGAIDIIPGNTDGQVLKWNNTSGQWEIGTDEQGSPIVDTETDDGLSNFDPATGYDVNVDGATIAINTSDQLGVPDDAITAAKLNNDVAGNGLDQNATTGAIDIIPGNAADQILKWNNTSLTWELGTDEQGSPIVDTDVNDGLSDFDPATGYNVLVDANTIAINASDQLEVPDDAITAAKLNNDVAGNGLDQNATTGAIDIIPGNAADQILKWNNTSLTWELGTDDTGGGESLATDDLIQDSGENRTYEIGSGQYLAFTGLGNIGFGNGANPPLSKFHFAGEVRSQGYNSTAGTAGAPAFSFVLSGTGNDSDTGIYRSAADEIGFSVGGNEALRMDEYQTNNTQVLIQERLGIGITLPPDSPYTGADVNSTLEIRGSFSAAITRTVGNTILDETNYTIILDGNHDIALPAANTCQGRIYIIKNNTAFNPSIDNFIDSSGTTQNTIPSNVTQLQSDGTDWQQIN